MRKAVVCGVMYDTELGTQGISPIPRVWPGVRLVRYNAQGCMYNQ